MLARRTALVAASSAALAMGLTGCEKPSPTVTMVADGKAVHTTAINWCRDGKQLTQANGHECPSDGTSVNVLSVYAGDKVSFDVDKALIKGGWYVFDTDLREAIGFQKDSHYFTFTPDFTNHPIKGVMNLEVQAVDHEASSPQDIPKSLGQWKFQLTLKD